MDKSNVTIILSIIAIIFGLSQPTYNLLTSLIQGERDVPSFDVYSFEVSESSTDMYIQNNGTIIATDVRVLLLFDDENNRLEGWSYTEFITEIKDGHAARLEIPIGLHLLESLAEEQGFTNISDYKAWVHIWCKELGEHATTFTFDF